MARSRPALRFGEKLDLHLQVGEDAPADAQALIVPQDVNLILGDVEPVVEAAGAEEPAAAGARFHPCRLGSVVTATRDSAPQLLIQAVVYDFDRAPPCREEHVFEAILAAFEQVKARGLNSIALRPIGTAHAGVPAASFLKVLAQICYSSAELGTSVRRVHLVLPSPAELERYERLLHGLMREE